MAAEKGRPFPRRTQSTSLRPISQPARRGKLFRKFCECVWQDNQDSSIGVYRCEKLISKLGGDEYEEMEESEIDGFMDECDTE